MNLDTNINKDNKKRYIWQIILTSSFILIVVGTSLALFLARASGNPFSVIGEDLVDIDFDNDSTLRLTNNVPIFPENIESDATQFDFRVYNPNDSSVYVTIDLTDINISDSLKIYDFKWALYEDETKLTTGTFLDADTTLNLYNNSVIEASSSQEYTIRIWLNETGEEQNLQGTEFTSTVKVTAYPKTLNTLASKILSETIHDTPTFSTTSTDRGLFVQKDDSEKSNFGFPIYYYKGSTKSTTINPTYTMNNYVSFGTYAATGSYVIGSYSSSGNSNFEYTKGDPIIWRVVRINEDGSIKLMSENISSSPVAWNSKKTTKYINDDGTDSEVKSAVETWYNSNIESNNKTNNKVQTSLFCSHSAARLNTYDQSFICPNTSTTLYSKVGLITADEVIYSGGSTKEQGANSSNLTYLSNGTIFWTSTYNSTNIALAWLTNRIDNYYTSSSAYASPRAVINLKPNVTVKSGTGSSTDPYVIK